MPLKPATSTNTIIGTASGDTLPEVKTVHHPESWEILYVIEYDDGSSQRQWIEVSQHDYELFRAERASAASN